VRVDSRCIWLLFDFISAAEHVVNPGEVVSTGEKGVWVALGFVILLQVGALAEVAHLSYPVSSRWQLQDGKILDLPHRRPLEERRS
jgi:hypothetical protein